MSMNILLTFIGCCILVGVGWYVGFRSSPNVKIINDALKKEYRLGYLDGLKIYYNTCLKLVEEKKIQNMEDMMKIKKDLEYSKKGLDNEA